MATRIRRTPEQLFNDYTRKAQAAKAKGKKMERAKQTRTAIIMGEALRGMANAGDAEAKLMVDRILAGLKRDQDRKAFDLEPLPEEGYQPGPEPEPGPDNQPEPGLLVIAQARRKRALEAWKGNDQSAELRSEMVNSIIAEEKLTGKCWENLPLNERADWGLSDRPGVLLRAS
jgi:hypothetical protein